MSENDENRHEDRMGTNVYSSKDHESLHKSLNGEFILYQLLLKRILEGKDSLSDNEKSLLKYFQPNETNDQIIMKEFDHEYQCEKAIYWYTRESCIYRILNKTLRTQNTDDIIPFGSFIRDLNTQLSHEHKSFVEKQEISTIQVYRGQLISKDEINRLKSGQGELISMNSFLSTSTNKTKALEFALSKSPPNDDLTRILLEIQVDFRALSKPYADIKHLSAFAEEEEILFMVSCVFRIEQIDYDEDKQIWMGKFILCSENDPDFKQFQLTIEKELEGQNQLISLAKFLIENQKFDQAQIYLENLLRNQKIQNSNDYAFCYYQLAKVHEKKGNYHLTEEYFYQSLNYLSNDDLLLSQIYNNLALFYTNYFINYDKAFEYFDKALTIKNNISSITYSGLAKLHFKKQNYQISLEYLEKTLENQSESSQAFLAETYLQMGKVYMAMNNKDKASEIFEKANQLQKEKFSKDHPDMSYTYTEIALMNSSYGNNEQTLEFLDKAYQLQLQTLPNNHPDLANTYQLFGDFYFKQNDLNQALVYYKKLLNNQLKTLEWNHPLVTNTYLFIGNIYWKINNYHHAKKYFQKNLQSKLEKCHLGHFHISLAYEILGNLYYDKYEKYSNKKYLNNTLNYYLHYLDNQLIYKLNQDSSLIYIYEKIAHCFSKKHHFDQALFYYYRSIDCYLQIHPLNQSNINQIYEFIKNIYLKKNSFNYKFEKQWKNHYEYFENIHFYQRHLDLTFQHFQNILKEKKLFKHSKEHIYLILGKISLEKQDFNQALSYLQKILNNQQSSQDFSLSNIYFLIGNIYAKQNNKNYAQQNYQQALNLSQNNSSLIKKIQKRLRHLNTQNI